MKRVFLSIMFVVLTWGAAQASGSGIVEDSSQIMDLLKEAASMNREYDSVMAVDRSLESRLHYEFRERLSRYDQHLTKVLADIYLDRLFGLRKASDTDVREYIELVCKSDFGVSDQILLEELEHSFGPITTPRPASSREYLIAMITFRRGISPEKLECLETLSKISTTEFNRMWYRVYANQLVSATDIEELEGLNRLIYEYSDRESRLLAEARKLEIERYHIYADEKETSAVMQALYARVSDLIRASKDYADEYEAVIENLKRMKSSFEREYFSSSQISTVVYPGESVCVQLNGYNIYEYEAILYRLPEDYRLKNIYETADFEEAVSRSEAVSRKNVQVEDPMFGINKKTTVSFDGIGWGDYLVAVTSGKSTEYRRFCSSSLFVAYRGGAEGMEAFIADSRSGAPYETVDMNVYDRHFNRYGSEYDLSYSKSLSVGDGFTPVVFDSVRSTDNPKYFNFSKGEDIYSPISYFYEYPVNKTGETYRYIATLLSDRPLYTYGDRVRAKVIVYDDRMEMVAEGIRLKIVAETQQGKPVYEGEVETDEFGAAMVEFMLDPSVRAGRIQMRAYGVDDHLSVAPAHLSLRLEDYYVPSIKVDLDRSNRLYAFDDRFELTGSVDTYSGIPLTGADVLVRYGTYDYRREALVKTDGEGRFAFETDLKDFSLGRKRYEYNFSVEVEATSPDGEKASARDYYTIGKKLSISCSLPEILFTDDSASCSLKLFGATGELKEVKWNVEVDGRASAEISRDISRVRSLKPGKHSLKIEATEQGQTVSVRRNVMVLNRTSSALPSGVDSVLIAEVWKEDPNHLVLYSATSEKNLHLFVEMQGGNGMLDRRNILLNDEARLLRLPIPEDYPESFTVAFHAVRNGKAYRYSRKIEEEIKEKDLEVSIEPSTDRMLCGESQNVRIRVCDAEGRPVQAQVLVSVYNSSLDRMGRPSWMLSRRGGHYAYDGRVYTKMTAVDGYQTAVRNDVAMDAPVMEEMTSALPMPAEGGNVRTDFNESLYYAWDLETDAEGYVGIDLKSGDLLTEFKIGVFAHTKDVLSGSADTTFTVSKKLAIEHSLPEILRAGDAVKAGIMLTNSSDEALTADLSAVCDDAGIRVGFDRSSMTLEAGQTASVGLHLNVDGGYFGTSRNVDDRGKVQVILSARSDSFSDSMEAEIEILPRYKTQYISKAYFIDEGESGKLEPFEGEKESLKLTLVSPYDIIRSAAYELKDRQSPTFVSMLAQFVSEQLLGVLSPTERESLETSESRFVDRLQEFQRNDGGISWIGGMKSSPGMTAVYCEQMNYMKSRGIYDYTRNPELEESVHAALRFLYSRMDEKCLENIHRNADVVGLLSLLVESGYEWNLEPYLEAYRRQIQEASDFRSYGIGELVAVMRLSHRTGDLQTVENAYDALKRYAVRKDGCQYFPNANPSQGQFDAEIEAHLSVMSVMDLCGKEEDVQRMMKWVLMQRSVYNWGTTMSTLKIAEFILSEYPAGNGKAMAKIDGLGRVRTDGTVSYNLSERSISQGLTVSNKGRLPIVAVVYASCNVRVDSLKVDYNDVEMFFSQSEDGNNIHYVYDLISPLFMQYVVFEGRMVSNLRNTGERSGLIYVGGVLCYREVRKDGIRYYFEEMPRGAMRIEEKLYRVMPGDCIVSMPTMYSE